VRAERRAPLTAPALERHGIGLLTPLPDPPVRNHRYLSGFFHIGLEILIK